MTERIDHAAEAVSYLHDNYIAFTGNQIRAQVHATLALVEQQRIANLIALSVPQQGLRGGELSMPSWIEGLPDGTGEIVSVNLRPDIAAALGLTAGGNDE